MFLIATADQRFWKTSDKVLFLGEWCRLYRYKSIWSELDSETLPYHWDDRKKYRQDYFYVDSLYEKYLSLLSKEMNYLHQVDYSNRYWRVIIGPWLYFFIGIFYDRFLSICGAIKSKKVTQTWIPPLHIERYVPKDFPTFRQWYWGDSYNQYLYGQIIKASGEIPFEIKTEGVSDSVEILAGNTPSIGMGKRILIRFLTSVGKLVPPRWNKIVFVSSYLNRKDLLRLQLKLRQFPSPFSPNVTIKDVSADFKLREKLKLSGEANQFESLLNGILPQQIPKVYVEGYADMTQKSVDSFPKAPRVIYTTNGFWGNDSFNFWAAIQTERGAKLVASQHGGCYGSAAWSTTEAHEIRVCDRYFSWGMENKDQPKVTPFPSGQLSGLHPRISSSPKGPILWVGVSVTRYASQLVSVPMSRQMLDYLNEQQRFAKQVSPEVHRLLVRRLFPKDYDWGERQRWETMDPDLKIYDGRKTMYQQLNESRLCVGTYHSTTDLETLAENYPTITYFNPKLNEFRDSAQTYFDELQRVGIFHTTPESAAKKVNEVYEDPLLWWNSKDVQDVRERFCYRFARTSKDWISEWKEELQKIAEE